MAQRVKININDGWKIDSSHFHITTNLSREAGVALATQLEELYTVWQQLFVHYTMNEWQMRRRFGGRGGVSKRPAKHEVKLFANRNQYIVHLTRLEPQIGITQGIYLDRRRTSYLFAGGDSPVSNWLHEVTHQLFHETKRVAPNVGSQANFWIVEGAALYMESLVRKNGYYTAGGVFSNRLQYARYRALSEKFYVPLRELCNLGRSELQRDERIRKLYSQSAGLAHFLMDYDEGKYRPALVEYLQAVYLYPGRDKRSTLTQVTGVEFEVLDREYHQFLGVTDADITNVAAPDNLLRLLLGHTQITDAGLKMLPDLAHIQQVDLSDTGITNVGLAHLARFKDLRTLWLTRTNVTGAGLVGLKSLMQLEDVDVTGTRVSQEEWGRFRQSMPHITDSP